jgi:hypothetical protein
VALPAQPRHRRAAGFLVAVWSLVAFYFTRARSRCVSDFVCSVTSANSAAPARVTDSENSENPSANGRSTVSPPFSRSRPLSAPSFATARSRRLLRRGAVVCSMPYLERSNTQARLAQLEA